MPTGKGDAQSIGRTSHEVRGLKYKNDVYREAILKSHLTRGAWIEMQKMKRARNKLEVAPHTRCVD